MTWRRSGFATACQRASALLVAVLLAFQTLVVQTHVHPAPMLSAAPISANGQARAATPLSEAQPPCLLCEEMALAGHYVPPAPVSLALASALAFWFQPSVVVKDAPRAISHRWRSRAPPSAPQA